jgi:nucleoside 2-deoxyribosyltransferase
MVNFANEDHCRRQAFIAVGYEESTHLVRELAAIEWALTQAGYEVVCLVRRGQAFGKNYKRMMATAKRLIQQSSVLLAVGAGRPTGVAVEAGLAAGLGKPLVYIAEQSEPLSRTIYGVATSTIRYRRLDELQGRVKAVVTRLSEW